MGYIGNEPTTGHFPVDNLTSSGGSTYTLSKAPASAGAIEVSVQGILQPTTAYSVSGTTLTLAGVANNVNIFVRHLGETLTLPTIADGVVTTSKLAVDAVGVAELSATGTASNTTFLRGDNSWQTAGSTSASDLTSGTLPDGRFPDPLPARSGANLTSLPAANLTGTVATARLGSGTASSSTFLRGDQTYAVAGENNHTSFARGFSGSGQNTAIATNTMTVVEFSAETFDSDGDFNTTTDRYIVPANGYYLITGAVTYSSLADGVLITAQIAINGGIKTSSANPVSINASNSCSVTDIYYCTTSQYIQLLTWHEKSSNASIDADGWGGSGPYGSGTYLSVARIG